MRRWAIYDLIIFDSVLSRNNAGLQHSFLVLTAARRRLEVYRRTRDYAHHLYTNNSHPVMFDVQMQNVSILYGQVIEGPKGSTNLVESIAGSVIAIGPRSGFEDIVVGFPHDFI